eukprot:365733-Chlamydomonas_euryale.AAC.12
MSMCANQNLPRTLAHWQCARCARCARHDIGCQLSRSTTLLSVNAGKYSERSWLEATAKTAPSRPHADPEHATRSTPGARSEHVRSNHRSTYRARPELTPPRLSFRRI